MDMISFLAGFLSAALAFAMFTDRGREEPELVTDDDGQDEVEINDYTGRLVTLSCQSCRKLRKHREIEPDMYKCTKCRRITDLRRSEIRGGAYDKN